MTDLELAKVLHDSYAKTMTPMWTASDVMLGGWGLMRVQEHWLDVVRQTRGGFTEQPFAKALAEVEAELAGAREMLNGSDPIMWISVMNTVATLQVARATLLAAAVRP